MNTNIETRFKTIFSYLSFLNTAFPNNNTIKAIDKEFSYLLDELEELPVGVSNVPTESTTDKTQRVISSLKAKLQVLNEIKSDLNFQKENRCQLENQQDAVKLSIKYVDRKIKYYNDNLNKIV